ncbi:MULTISPECIES: DUF3168 domain-containing protein [Methylobacterium]|uniref:DUF3168 domain-containing protein n=3 Tax=Pseudomonadota TaxID=1224 RepID=A0ABQ4T0W1_9HYPH|nr:MULTISPECIES: DUF3168 domain-containing protein [Methylobacterium]PIU08205.1 MAG: hypothetical protein COT56_02475 [Methylobacterium sp. CG09_land_8_20_14_0_10_71_15]PIU15715.1 MAG: hypothetical protein COT28_03725 [Methylobacterium sp. CG08_land_8_20_14_0_20_71_15]GBU17220.1 hypothetical protein AwMethylo_14350 [Methylobacterium sp.]GJE07865.1 hypothetical protein AOPFMNJM_3197 [Methylobacterium jeotgali]
MTPELALRNQIGMLLRASPAVTALVGKKIRDDVPSDKEADKLPWLCMGPISVRRIETGDAPAWSISLRVLAESAGFNRDEVWQIARAAMRAIDRAEPPEELGFVDRIAVQSANDVIDPGAIKTVAIDVSCTLIDVD